MRVDCGKEFAGPFSPGSAEDLGHQVSFRRRHHDLSDNGGLFRCSALDDVIWFGL